MARRNSRRIKVKRKRACGSQKQEHAHVTVAIERGGPQWVSYAALQPDRRKEWDAFEQILIRLSQGMQLYVSGSFRHWPETLHERFVMKKDHEGWTGMCRIGSAEELHGLLVANPDTVGYGYLVTKSALSEKEAFRIVKRHHGWWGGRDMDNCIIEACPLAFCGIEECIDRDWFGLECRLEDYQHIEQAIADTLKQFKLI